MRKRILYLQYTNPAAFPPVEHSSNILARGGWEVLFLGISLAGLESLALPPHANIKVKLLSPCEPGWRQKFHFLCFCIWTLIWVMRWRPRWIYASDLFSTPAALILKTVFGKKVVYHEHDSPGQTAATWFISICFAARRRLGKIADVVIVPNKVRGEIFRQEQLLDRNDIQCVWNCPLTAEVSPAAKKSLSTDLWIIYHGSIDPERLPVTLIQALATLPEQIKLRVIGYETVTTRGYVDMLLQIADQYHIVHRIEFLGAVPRKDVLTWCRLSDIGLSFVPCDSVNINIRQLTGASNKPFDNLACGIPLLVSNLPEWRTMFVEPGYALSCDHNDPEDIARVISWYMEHPVEMRSMGESGRQRILSEWNYDKQFAPVMTILDSNL